MTPLYAMFLTKTLVHLSLVDYVIVAFYFVLVLAIGWYLKGRANTGEDFFMAGREMTAWVAGLSFLSANLGALELMGWAGSAYQYGILATHWYWIGAIPAMLFLALVMMPFYYISKTHSVPGYLKLRFGEPARAVSAVSFALMTVLMSGVNMFAMAKVMQIVLQIAQRASEQYVHLWSGLGHFGTNPMGIHWTGIVFGLGSVISMGYWTTDFLVVQRILAAKDIRSAEMAPIIGAGFKMMVPFIVILPGLLGLGLLPMKLVPESVATVTGGHSYNDVLPLMLARYCGPGLLGLGITALIAGFMSGMAGNVSAFTTVWTYDIYRPLINPKGSDHHYVNMGRWTTIIGVLISIGTAYLVMEFASIMDYVQALFSFFVAPLFGTVLLGMLWKRATGPGGFWGLLCGTLSSIGMWAWVKVDPTALRYVALSADAKALAQDMYQALWSFIICVAVTVVVSYVTKPKPTSELAGLVYGETEIPAVGDVPFYQKPLFWAGIVVVVFFILNIIFW